MAQILISLILILVAAKIAGELFERIGQPPVLGELIAGVILGGSVLGWVKASEPLLLLSQLGVILLLFEIGLESDLPSLLKVGLSAFTVALVGTAGTFLVGYFAVLLLGLPPAVALFTGASLTATSVGITARTLKDLRRLDSPEAHIVLGAAVIDDIMGLIILAAVGGFAAGQGVSVLGIGWTTVLAVAFLVGSVALGIFLAPYVLRFACNLQSRGIITVGTLVFCLGLAVAADKLHLAAIIGAFAAGLILSRSEPTIHVRERIKPLADVFIPVFFVLLGTSVNIGIFNPFNPSSRHTLLLIAALFVAAVLMKLLAGQCVLVRGVRRWAVGAGMVPRGEVTLIFASTGLAGGLISPSIYSAILAVVILTTFLTPGLLKVFFSNHSRG